MPTKYASSLMRDMSFNRSPLCLHSAFLKELLVNWFHLNKEQKILISLSFKHGKGNLNHQRVKMQKMILAPNHEMKCRGSGDQARHCVHRVVVEERAKNY